MGGQPALSHHNLQGGFTMKRLLTVSLVLLVCILVALPAIAAEKKAAGKPGGVVAEMVSVTATVEAVDFDKRLVTLKGPKGNKVTIQVPPEAKNLDQVKVGDAVKVDYYESVAVSVQKAEGKPSAGATSTVKLAPKGAKPQGAVVETVEVTAAVEAIDYKARTVALKGPEGNVETFTVDKSVKKLNQVKKGDQVVLRYTRALALALEKQATQTPAK
jgi:competence protein ComGC